VVRIHHYALNTSLVPCRSGLIAGSKLVHDEEEGLSMTLAVLLQRGEQHVVRRPPPGAEYSRSPSPPVRSPSPSPVHDPAPQQVPAWGHTLHTEAGVNSWWFSLQIMRACIHVCRLCRRGAWDVKESIVCKRSGFLHSSMSPAALLQVRNSCSLLVEYYSTQVGMQTFLCMQAGPPSPKWLPTKRISPEPEVIHVQPSLRSV